MYGKVVLDLVSLGWWEESEGGLAASLSEEQRRDQRQLCLQTARLEPEACLFVRLNVYLWGGALHEPTATRQGVEDWLGEGMSVVLRCHEAYAWPESHERHLADFSLDSFPFLYFAAPHLLWPVQPFSRPGLCGAHS